MTNMVAPDGGWGWLVVVAVSAIHLLEAGAVRAVGVFYVEFLNRFQGSATATAWVCAIASLLWSGLGPIVSSLTEYFGARAVTVVGGVLMFLGYIGAALSDDLFTLSLTFGLVLGVGLAFCYVPGYVIVGQYFDKRKGLAMSLATVGGGLGNFIFPPVIGALFHVFGYRGTMALLAAVSLHVVAFALLYRPLQPSRLDLRRLQRAQQKGHVTSQTNGKAADVNGGATDMKNAEEQLELTDKGREEADTAVNGKGEEKKEKQCQCARYMCEPALWRSVPILLFLILTFNAMNVFMSTATFLPALAIDMGVDPNRAIFLLSIVGISDCIARVPFGFLFDLAPVKRIRSIVYICMITVVGIGCLCMPLMKSYAGLVVLACVRGSLSGTFMAQRATILHDYVGKELVAQAFGLLLFATCLGSFVARLVGGALKDGLGSYDLAFYTSSLGLIASAVCFLIYELVTRWRKRSTPAVPVAT